jgi:hypothetical protein
MPELVSLIIYPWFKPVNNKGVIVRQFVVQDRLYIFIPSVSIQASEANAVARLAFGSAIRVSPTDRGLTTVTVPSYTVIASETASGGYQVT